MAGSTWTPTVQHGTVQDENLAHICCLRAMNPCVFELHESRVDDLHYYAQLPHLAGLLSWLRGD